MKKGKSRTRTARRDIMRANEANARRRARQQQQARTYDKRQYDKPEEGGGPPRGRPIMKNKER